MEGVRPPINYAQVDWFILKRLTLTICCEQVMGMESIVLNRAKFFVGHRTCPLDLEIHPHRSEVPVILTHRFEKWQQHWHTEV